MVIGYVLVIGGIVFLLSGNRSGIDGLMVLGGAWAVAGIANIALSQRHRTTDARVPGEDSRNPIVRARLYQGVPGQLFRGLVALSCVLGAAAVAILHPFTAAQTGWRILLIIVTAFVGFLTVVGLLSYAFTGVERSATIPATVSIRGFKELPMTNGNQPYVRLELDVHPAGGADYRSTVQTLVPQLAIPRIEVGARFPALVAGPAKPNRVIVDFSAATRSAADPVLTTASSTPQPPVQPSPADRIRELDELLNQGLVTDEEYEVQRTRILDSL